ncbi:hypothetical protein TRVL_08582 [Trypanosoma vivax]|nr:hypothetical protein TRVL_08582 [Trypanosoma vivax]
MIGWLRGSRVRRTQLWSGSAFHAIAEKKQRNFANGYFGNRIGLWKCITFTTLRGTKFNLCRTLCSFSTLRISCVWDAPPAKIKWAQLTIVALALGCTSPFGHLLSRWPRYGKGIFLRTRNFCHLCVYRCI